MNLLAKLIVLGVYTEVNAFLHPSFVSNIKNVRRVDYVLHAKPPPTSQFDLNAIEALEAELDYEDKLKMQDFNDDEEESDADDWDLFSDYNCNMETFEVTKEQNNKRIDAILSEFMPDISRSQCGNLITDGSVAILTPGASEAGRKPSVSIRKSEKLVTGTILHVKNKIEEPPTEIIPQNLPLDILYEDENMIVLNKAAGMVVHPAVGNWDGTVVNALAHYLAYESPFGSGDFIENDGKVKSEKGSGIDVDGTHGEAVTFRPGIVHRLDKGTTGVLIVAKTRDALAALSEAFANREVKKTYVAITVGNPGKRIVIDKPIGRHPIHRQKMRVVPETGPSAKGRNALSYVDTLAFSGKLSIAEVRIETGRTHQIRVHLQDRTTPIYGDEVYGFGDWNKRLLQSQGIQRPLLHAFKLELKNPFNGKKMIFRAPMAEDMATVAMGIWPLGTEERKDLFERMDVEIIEE
jgi:23S rRNA pseudouridine1911/1915/1917 synthase